MDDLEQLCLKPEINQEVSYSELSLGKKILSLISLFRMALPVIIAFECRSIANLINLIWLGKYENSDVIIGSISLGHVWNMLLIGSLIFSMNQGLSVLTSHAFGAGKKRLCGHILQRGIVICFSTMIPLIPLVLFGKPIMLSMGVKPELADNAQTYNRISIVAVAGAGLFDCLKSFIIAQKVFDPIIYIQIITLGLHFLWSYLFLNVLHLGVLGVALCRICEDWTNCALLFIYIKTSGKFDETFVPWDNNEAFGKEALIKQVKFTLPMAGVTYFQFIYFDFMVILAGMLGTQQVVAHLTVSQTSSSYFFLVLGLSITSMSLLGNALGERNIQKAKDVFTKCIHLSYILCMIIMLGLSIFKKQWYSLWTTDPETLNLIFTTHIILILGILPLDSALNSMLAVLKACGKQKTINKWTLIGFYCIGVPVTIALVFGLHFEVPGVWFGFFTAYLFMGIIFVRETIIINWKEVVDEIHSRLKSTSYHDL